MEKHNYPIPPVSVIMAVYNSSKTLLEALESIGAQTFADFECIIIDDCSTDNSAQILEQYASRDPRFKIIRNSKNLGLTRSLNKALAVARGTYIARMDADDVSLPERFAAQLAFLQTNLDCSLVGTWATVIDAVGSEIDHFEWETDPIDIRKNLIKYNCVIHPTWMMRRTLFEQIGGYDESFRFAQDYDFLLRAIRVTKIANIPKRLLKYRVSKSSVTGNKNMQQAWCGFRARLKAIRSGTYNLPNMVYLVRPLVGMVVPLWVKRIVKKTAL